MTKKRGGPRPGSGRKPLPVYELSTAAKKFRKWQVDGMVIRDGDYFIHKTKIERSREIFIQAVIVLGGEVLDKSDNPGDHRTFVTLPRETLSLVKPRPRPGWPADAPREGRPRIPDDEKRVQQGARFDPATRPLAEAIAQELGLKNWAWAVDEAVRRMAEEMGITG